MKAAPRSILFLNFNKIGDTLLQTQLFGGLKLLDPSLTISVLCTAAAYEVLRNNPHLDLIRVTQRIPERSPWEFLRYRSECLGVIRERGVDTVVCDTVNATPVTAILMRGLPIKYRIYAAPILKRHYRFLTLGLTHLNAKAKRYTAIRDQNLAILRYFGFAGPLPKVEVYPSEDEKRRADRFVQEARSACDRPLLGVAPFSAQDATSWPIANITEFINKAAQDFGILLFGSPADVAKIPGAISNKSRVFSASHLNLREAFWAIRQAALLVTLDSGPSHFFEALERPMLRLDSARIPSSQWGYDGAPDYHSIQLQVPCGPCHSRDCKTSGHPCMAGITPDLVLAKVRSILG